MTQCVPLQLFFWYKIIHPLIFTVSGLVGKRLTLETEDYLFKPSGWSAKFIYQI